MLLKPPLPIPNLEVDEDGLFKAVFECFGLVELPDRLGLLDPPPKFAPVFFNCTPARAEAIPPIPPIIPPEGLAPPLVPPPCPPPPPDEALADGFTSTAGAERSLVTAFLSRVPLLISLSKAPRAPLAGGGVKVAGGGGGAPGGGGGGAGIFALAWSQVLV